MVCVVTTILTPSLILPPLSPGLQGVRRDHRPGLPDVEEGDEDDEEAEEEEQRQTLPAEESRAAIRVLVEPPESEGREASPPPPPPPPVVTVEAPRVVSGKRHTTRDRAERGGQFPAASGDRGGAPCGVR